MSSIVMEIRDGYLQTPGAAVALEEVDRLLKSEIKKYRRQDIILSEREIAENEKIAKVLEDLIPKIKNITNRE